MWRRSRNSNPTCRKRAYCLRLSDIVRGIMAGFNLGDILVNIKANTDGLKKGLGDVQNMGNETKALGDKIQKGMNVAAAGLAVVGAGLTVYAKGATDFTVD